jgi:uncharacterized protein YvpB
MDTTLLAIPYVSQRTPGATQHHNDCGAACMSMMLKAFNLAKDLTVDELYDAVNPTNADVSLTGPAIVSKMKVIGLPASWRSFSNPASLFAVLQNGKPVIALIHYETLITRGYSQYKNFTKGHFVIISGMDIANVFIQDPNRDDGVTVVAVPITVFWEAWGQCKLDNNLCFSGIVPDLPITDLAQNTTLPGGPGKYVLTVNGAYVHAEPNEYSPKVSPTIVWRGKEPNLTVVTILKVINNYGYRLGGGWVCMDLLKPA